MTKQLSADSYEDLLDDPVALEALDALNPAEAEEFRHLREELLDSRARKAAADARPAREALGWFLGKLGSPQNLFHDWGAARVST